MLKQNESTTMKKEELFDLSLGEIVTRDFRAASVFREAGLDFCCGGKKNLLEACNEKNTDPEAIAEQLVRLNGSAGYKGHNYSEWSPSFLADYIINTHHKYIMNTLPDLLYYTDKIARVHGVRHKELYQVAELVVEINDELTQHLKKEEDLLFPAIKNVYEKRSTKEKPLIKTLLKKMATEHEYAGSALDRINSLTQGYLIPGDGCSTYALTMKLLGEFEDDLHTHVHLENNILYPAAQKIAEQ
jgi:regulator of cell morphogenesis and NO signaling